MTFYARKRRHPPAVIIVPLIDILMVLLIFMMATSTFKLQPAIRLTLPESRQGREGAAIGDSLVISIARAEPYLSLDNDPVDLEQLETALRHRAGANPDLIVSIRADTEAFWGNVVAVMDAVKEAGFRKPIVAFTRHPSP